VKEIILTKSNNKKEQSAPIVSSYHTYNGEVHKGHSSDCKTCKGKKPKKTPLEHAKEIGSTGGKKSGTLRDRHCKCGKKIRKSTVTGKCLECYTAWVKEQHAQLPKSTVERKYCRECNRQLDHRNRSGYCRVHYNKSLNFQEQVKQHSAWSTTVVFGKDVKTAKDTG